MKIIFAQGNPGQNYALTRHNVGFRVLDKFNATWVNKSKFNSEIAEIEIRGEKAILVKPLSFYNDTGNIVRKLIDFYKVEPCNDLLVVHDDLALPFGTIRVREKGSDGGNNGVKSINQHVGDNYHRIRIGIYNELRERMDDADFVLSKFSSDESDQLNSTIIPHVIDLINQFCSGEIEKTSYKI